jgi:hypothetical protein
MKKAWKLLQVMHTFCVAHGIHNLLIADCFPKLDVVPDLLDKIQMIINKLRYRQQELEEEFYRLNDQMYYNLLSEINKAGEILDADSISSYIDVDDLNELNENEENNGLTVPVITNDSNVFHTLKKRILTRWNTILIMLRSYASNISCVENLMRRMKHYDLILSAAENQIVNDLIGFLSSFESTTTILSASKSYTTMNLYLLLRMVSIEQCIFVRVE